MKLLVTALFMSTILMKSLMADEISIPMQAFIKDVLIPFPQKNQEIIQAVIKHNEEWKNTTDLTPFMFSLMSNQCAYELFRLANKYPFIREASVMDEQGTLVCLTHKTSDYWQGDKDKFIQSFAKGKGDIHYADEEYDENADELARQISVPVIHENQAIGAITFTLGVDSWELRK